MAIDTSLPIKGQITDSGGNPVQGVEVSLWRRVLADNNSDGGGDEITDTQLLARTQTDSNGEYEFSSNDVPATYQQGDSEVIYYCTVHALDVESGSGDPLDNGRIKAYSSDNEPAASDYMVAYSLKANFPLIVDGFNDGDLSEYTVVGGDIFGINTSNPLEGAGTLEIANESNVTNFYEDLIYASESSLDFNRTPQKGDIFSCLVYEPDISTGTNPNFGFAGDSNGLTGYTFIFAPSISPPEIQLRRLDGAGSTTTLASDGDSVYGVGQEAFEAEVEWHDGTGSEPDNTIVARLYELDSNLDRIQQIGSDIKAQDSTYANQSEIFFAAGSGNLANGRYADRYQIVGEV
jgi:hypothetical protein